MDIASIAGLLLGIVVFVYGVIAGGSSLGIFFDFPSILITFFGSLTSCLSSFKLADFINGLSSIRLILKDPPGCDPTEVIKNIMSMANIARKEGLLALEESAQSLEDEFLKKGIMLVVDGTDAELVRAILENDMDSTNDRHKKAIAFWEKWGEMGPAWGMIGTLIGLVIMLQNMSDASSIGPAMAVALLTTLYGSLIANWLANPVAGKLSLNNDIEYAVRTVAVEGLLSIQAGENPRVIEEKLKTFLAPKIRESMGAGNGGE